MEKYVISPHLKTIKRKDKNLVLVYNSILGKPLILNREALELLDFFIYPQTVEEVKGQCEGDPSELVKSFMDNYFIVRESFRERNILEEKKQEHLEKVVDGVTIDRMGLAISDVCNLACSHCIHFSQKYMGNLYMKWEIAKRCIDQYVELLKRQGQELGKIHFGNAEPLLNWKVIDKVLSYCTYRVPEIKFEFAINTNLLLLTEDIAEKLKKFNVKIATSLDGVAKANDLIRVDRRGKGTFAKIMEKFKLLYNIGFPLDGFSITVTDKNFPYINEDVIDLAADFQMEFIAFDYDLVNSSNISTANKIEKLLRLKSYANSLNIEFFGTWDSIYRNLTSGDIMKEPHSFCAALEGRSLEFDVDGKVKVCGHSNIFIGDLSSFDDIFKRDSDFVKLVSSAFPGERRYCRGCEFEGLCNGQCLVTREACLNKKNNLQLFTDMCSFYKSVTKELVVQELL